MRRGVERGSVPIIGLRVVHPSSEEFFSQYKLISAIIMLCMREVGQSHFLGVSQGRGRSIRVGIKIFSIGVGLSFVAGLYRGFGLWRQVGLIQRLPRKLKKLVLIWGKRSSQRRLVVRIIVKGQ